MKIRLLILTIALVLASVMVIRGAPAKSTKSCGFWGQMSAEISCQ
jgi:hypothetical protein